MHSIPLVENYVRATMTQFMNPDLRLAHDYSHVDRVRHWAVHIAEQEGYPHTEYAEAAALLHDIGLAFVTHRKEHAAVGAVNAAAYLRAHSGYSAQAITAIAEAIDAHNSLSGGGELGAILRDADMLDLFGPVGIMRACVAQYATQPYDQEAITGTTWGLTSAQFTQRFRNGQGVGPTIMDSLNFHLSCGDNLTTQTAKQLALPLLAYTRSYMVAFAAQVDTKPSGR